MEPKLPESQASVLPLSVGVDGGIRTDSRVRGGGFKSQLHPSLPKWFWSSCLSFLSSTFLICTMGILIDPCRITHVKCRLYPGPFLVHYILHRPLALLCTHLRGHWVDDSEGKALTGATPFYMQHLHYHEKAVIKTLLQNECNVALTRKPLELFIFWKNNEEPNYMWA